MGHGEGWHYLQAGRFLERAVATARLLDTFFTDESGPVAMPPLDRADWVALLRSCAALEGYCRQYTADVRPERVTEFLLLNAECPRSVRFAAARVEDALQALARHSGRSTGAGAERLAGRLRASLDYAQVDEVLSEGPHAYLRGTRPPVRPAERRALPELHLVRRGIGAAGLRTLTDLRIDELADCIGRSVANSSIRKSVDS